MTATDAETPEVTNVTLPMVCVCREDGQAKAAGIRAEVIEALDLTELHQKNISSSLLYAMHGLFKDDWEVEVFVDMWMGLNATNGKRTIRVECDLFEDGLLAITKYLIDSGELEEEEE